MKSRRTNKRKRSNAFLFLYYWGKIVGINPLKLLDNDDVEFSYYGLLYGLALVGSYIYAFYRILMERARLRVPGETPIAVIVNILSVTNQFVKNSFTCWLLCALSQTRMKRMIERVIEIERISSRLAISDDYTDNFRVLRNYVVATNVAYVVSLSFSILFMSYVTTYNVVPWIFFNLPRISSYNMEILFSWLMIILRRKFRRLNAKLRYLLQKDNVTGDEETTKLQFTNESRSQGHPLSVQISTISRLHRKLRSLLNRIEEYFMPVFLFGALNHIFALTLSFYSMYRYLKAIGGLKGFESLLHIGASYHWILHAFLVMIVLSQICCSTLREANNTGNILHAMVNEFGDNPDDIAKFEIFSLDLLKNRVTISLCGFFPVDDFFVYAMISITTTYLVIMLQFYT